MADGERIMPEEFERRGGKPSPGTPKDKRISGRGKKPGPKPGKK
jgi:hypothetical protein